MCRLYIVMHKVLVLDHRDSSAEFVGLDWTLAFHCSIPQQMLTPFMHLLRNVISYSFSLTSSVEFAANLCPSLWENSINAFLCCIFHSKYRAPHSKSSGSIIKFWGFNRGRSVYVHLPGTFLYIMCSGTKRVKCFTRTCCTWYPGSPKCILCYHPYLFFSSCSAIPTSGFTFNVVCFYYLYTLRDHNSCFLLGNYSVTSHPALHLFIYLTKHRNP